MDIFICTHLVRYPCPIGIGSPWNTGTVREKAVLRGIYMCTSCKISMSCRYRITVEHWYRTRDPGIYPARYGHTPGITLHPRYILSLLQCHTYLPGGILRVRVQVTALRGGLPGIPPGISPCIQGSTPWVLYVCIQCPTRGCPGIRCVNGHSIHGVCTPLGGHVLLGSNRHYQPVYRCPLYGTLVPGGPLPSRARYPPVLYHTLYTSPAGAPVPGTPCTVCS